MLHIWNKQISSVGADEIKKAMVDYETLNDDDLWDILNEELKNYNLSYKSLFKEYYIKFTDEFLTDLWNTPMKDVTFEWKDYKTLQPKGMLIYCDPPYANTTKYTGTPSFDSNEFWDVMRRWSNDNDVYISEYEAPADFISVLDIPTKTSIRDKTDTVCARIEKLFTYNI